MKVIIKSLTQSYEEKLNNQADMFRSLMEKERNALKEKLIVRKNKFKSLEKKSNRTQRKLETVMQALKTSKTLSNEAYDIVSSDMSSISSQIFENECKNQKKERGRRYSDDVKRFALTLHYHSPKAYEFCRSACAYFLLDF